MRAGAVIQVHKAQSLFDNIRRLFVRLHDSDAADVLSSTRFQYDVGLRRVCGREKSQRSPSVLLILHELHATDRHESASLGRDFRAAIAVETARISSPFIHRISQGIRDVK